jgi:hypothetical protein
MKNLLIIFLIASLVTFAIVNLPTASAQVCTNTIRQVQEINGTYPVSVSTFDVSISPPLERLDKSMAFLTFAHSQQNLHSDTFRSWNFTALDTLTIYGNDFSPSANTAVSFHGTIFEYNDESCMFAQHLEFNMTELLPEGEFEISIPTAINSTTSFIIGSVRHDGVDSTIGTEEFTRWRILNSTFYGIEVGDTPNDGNTIYHTTIVDANVTNVSVQRGQGELPLGETIDTITPPLSFIKNQTLLFVSFKTTGDLSQDPDDVAISATINGANEILVQRADSSSNEVQYNWELIELESGLATVQHFNGSQASGTGLSFEKIPVAITNLNNSWAIGTVFTPFGYGNARSDTGTTGAFDRSTATITLENTTDVELIRLDSVGSFDVGLQVIEWTDVNNSVALLLGDVASAVDSAINFDVFKSLGDVSTVNDNVILNLSTAFITNQSDIVLATDNVFLNITKFVSDDVNATDNVIISKIIPLLINASDNTVTALDSVFLFLNTTIPPTPPPTGSGGSTFQPDPPTLSPVRLIGLDVNSELLFVQPASQIPSDFLITWFGTTQEDVKITNIEPSEGFASFNDWFVYTTPETLDISTTEGFENRFPTDPRSELNQALNAFQVIAPRNECIGSAQDEITASCLNPILYEIPMEFEFDVKGAKFKTQHIVQIDARLPEACGLIFDAVICFIEDNWIILAVLALLFIIIVGVTKRKRRKVKTVHIIRSRDIDQLGEGRTSRKFKKLRRK